MTMMDTMQKANRVLLLFHQKCTFSREPDDAVSQSDGKNACEKNVSFTSDTRKMVTTLSLLALQPSRTNLLPDASEAIFCFECVATAIYDVLT